LGIDWGDLTTQILAAVIAAALVGVGVSVWRTLTLKRSSAPVLSQGPTPRAVPKEPSRLPTESTELTLTDVSRLIGEAPMAQQDSVKRGFIGLTVRC
jgi:hypothetical protein